MFWRVFPFFVLSILAPWTSSAGPEDGYPEEWWQVVPESERQSWEVLPQDAGPNEVILSKRTELGVFSNLGRSAFVLDKIRYASVEALWQMMKYPDPDDPSDLRWAHKTWPLTRRQVWRLYGFEAKDAGDYANKIMKDLNIDWVSYETRKFNSKDMAAGSEYHLEIIQRAIQAKIDQNPNIKRLLLQTRGLTLRPDHTIESTRPPAYFYHRILMAIRDQTQP